MSEIEEAARTITRPCPLPMPILFLALLSIATCPSTIKITVIATGFDSSRQHFYQAASPKKIKLPSKTDELTDKQTSSIDNTPDFSDILDHQEIPPGVDITDEFDIPSFLRKNK